MQAGRRTDSAMQAITINLTSGSLVLEVQKAVGGRHGGLVQALAAQECDQEAHQRNANAPKDDP
jgi:hypothetical protein